MRREANGLCYFRYTKVSQPFHGALALVKSSKPNPMNYNSISQDDVPKGRDGKHKHVVTQILSDLDQLAEGRALKIPLVDLPDTKENIRSALNRATRLRNMDVATSSDSEFLYIWKGSAPTVEIP